MADEPLGAGELSAWRQAFESGRPTGASPCPDDERLAALVTGELSGAERERVADHVVVCRRCAEAYRTLAELHAEAQRRSAARGRLRPWAVAAGLVLVTGLALLAGRAGRWAPGRDPGDVLRSTTAGQGVVPAPGAVLAAAPPGFRWPPLAGAPSRLRLFDAEAELVWESAVEGDGALSLPGEVAARLRSGASYYWVVESEAGGARRRLGPFWFEIGAR